MKILWLENRNNKFQIRRKCGHVSIFKELAIFTHGYQEGIAIKCLIILILTVLSGCVAYRVQTTPDPAFDHAVKEIASIGELDHRLSVEDQQIHSTTAIGEQTAAVFCSEPLVSFLTLGIVPRVCTRIYKVTLLSVDSTQVERDYQTKSVSGWLAVLLLPSGDWSYGFEEDWSEIIKQRIAGGTE